LDASVIIFVGKLWHFCWIFEFFFDEFIKRNVYLDFFPLKEVKFYQGCTCKWCAAFWHPHCAWWANTSNLSQMGQWLECFSKWNTTFCLKHSTTPICTHSLECWGTLSKTSWEHFAYVYRNVTPKHITKGFREYVKQKNLFAKNKIILSHTNLVERAITFWRYEMKKQLGNTLPSTR